MPETLTAPETRRAVPSKVTFRGDTEYFKTLRYRVNQHFAGRKRQDDPRLILKVSIIAVWFFASYALLLASRSAPLQLLLCLNFAWSACALGFNVFHDSIHDSFSSSSRVNLILSRIACAVLGVGRKFWWHKHNVLHHRFTNIFEWDDDLETRDSLRLSPRQPWKAKFKYQHLFFPLPYSLTTLEWIFVKDFVQYFTMKMSPYQDLPSLTRSEKIEFWACKAIYFGLFVLLPFAVLPWQRVVPGLLLFHLMFGLSLALIFNLAHAMERADFPVPTRGSVAIEEEWAAHQMRTTVNFANGSRVLNWFSGGLNFQIEHHLFPNISHTHYPELSPIVRRTAMEFGLPYNQYGTYASALTSHFRILRTLGAVPSPS